MTDPQHTAQRELALKLLARRAGPAASAETIAAAAERVYDDLGQVLAPVIGDVGVVAMTDRALRLAAREYSWLPAREPDHADTQFTQVIDALKLQEPATARDAAAAVFAAILRLLATFIGEPLAGRLVQQAWPDAVASVDTEET